MWMAPVDSLTECSIIDYFLTEAIKKIRKIKAKYLVSLVLFRTPANSSN